MSSRASWSLRRMAAIGALIAVSGSVAPPAFAQRANQPEVSVGAGFARQPDDNSGTLARTGAHLQGALRVPVGDRAAARLTLIYEHFGVHTTSGETTCQDACAPESSGLPFALGIASVTFTGRSDSFGGRLYGGAGAGVHHAFRSPWLGERTGLSAHAILGATLGEDHDGLGIEASVHHLMSAHGGVPWLVPIGLTWTF